MDWLLTATFYLLFNEGVRGTFELETTETDLAEMVENASKRNKVLISHLP